MLIGASVFSGSQMTVEGPSQAETAPTTASGKGFPSTLTEQFVPSAPFSIRQSPFAGCEAEASSGRKAARRQQECRKKPQERTKGHKPSDSDRT